MEIWSYHTEKRRQYGVHFICDTVMSIWLARFITCTCKPPKNTTQKVNWSDQFDIYNVFASVHSKGQHVCNKDEVS